MSPRLLAVCVALSWGAALAAQHAAGVTPATAPAAGPPADAARHAAQVPGTVDYTRDIQPLLARRCGECHNGTKRKGGLALDTYADILDGGKDGPIVQPGRSADSMIVQRLRGAGDEDPMPKDEDPLPDAEIALIARWIDEGVRATPGGPAAPAPWVAPLTLARPAVPGVIWPAWREPIDRVVADYFRTHGTAEPAVIDDARFARRAYLDLWGLLPTPEQLQAFLDDRAADKRAKLARRLLDDETRYAEHWISFWNDLLRNDDGVSYFSENAGRKSITPWLLRALQENRRYDRFVADLINPTRRDDPAGFVTGVNWRGETSAAVTPWMQAAQNTSQVFLGVNLKCASCHDSFVNKWKLKDAYGLAAYFSPDASLQMFRCDLPQDRRTGPGFLFPGFARTPRSAALAHRRAAAAATFTDPRLGRLPRTLVNRIWQRLLGRGIVATVDEMDGEPWSPALLDWLAADFADHDYDVKHLIETIVTSRAYQLPAVRREAEAPARGYVFRGPEVRRLSAEQFADAIGSITGEWSVAPPPPAPAARPAPRSTAKPDPMVPLPSQSTSYGIEAREWRAPSSTLTRGLGRPIRDQITSIRAADATTLQALELTNGAVLSRWLTRGARRMLGELPPDPVSRYTRTVAGRNATQSRFDIDVSGVTRLWLVVEDTGSNVPEALLPAWADAELIGPKGATPLAALTPIDTGGLRHGEGPVAVPTTNGGGIRVGNPSTVVYDVAGRGFTRFRGAIGIENPRADIGSTLNPALRFYVFDAAPNPDRLLPATPGAPLPRPAAITTIDGAVDRVFRHALGRPPRPAEKAAAVAALRPPADGDRPSPEGLADLLWAVLVTPEFQILD
jgi:hypothetical protein